MPEESPKNHLKRDSEYWFEDGTIILIADDTEFRVYRGLLAERFPVFKDMLSFPQPTPVKDEEVVVSCPRVFLSDSAIDWRHVFRLFMPWDNAKHFSKMPPSPPYETIAACIRLGHKYQMMQVYDCAMNHLKAHFTTILDVWDRTPTMMPNPMNLSQSIGIVNLARRTGEHTILPTALLCCCSLDRTLAYGFRHSDGTMETLSQSDLALCLEAKPRLFKATMLAYLQTYEPLPYESCKADDSTCESLMVRFRKKAERDLATSETLNYPLINFKYRLVGEDVDQLCSGCAKALAKRQNARRREFWKSLPSMFGLDVPGWK